MATQTCPTCRGTGRVIKYPRYFVPREKHKLVAYSTILYRVIFVPGGMVSSLEKSGNLVLVNATDRGYYLHEIDVDAGGAMTDWEEVAEPPQPQPKA